MNELLKQLTEAVGVSSGEKEVRRLIRDLIEPHVDEWHVDAMGNLIAVKKGTGEQDLRVVVDAHMDEIGLMVTEVDSSGMAKFDTVGGIDARALLGKVVQVGEKKHIGVIGARPIHLLTGSQRSTVTKTSSMRIDIGALKKDQAASKVKPGDLATFVTEYEEWGTTAVGKAFDNRAGCAALIELLRKDPYPFDLIATFTVQEEVGVRGAEIAAYHADADVALVLECTPAYDQPNEEDASPNVSLGRGPSIYVMDARTIQDPKLVSHITNSAESHNIPFQIRRPGGGGTNTSAMQRARGPVSAATIAVPARYIHSPISMINLDDYAHVIDLADATLRSLTAATIQRNLA